MTFDPDAFLRDEPEVEAFDPDAFLADETPKQEAPSFDPDEFLGTAKPVTPVRDRATESSYRDIASKYLGTGTTAQQVAGQDPGAYQKFKGGLNQLTDSRDAVSIALRNSGGDIDKAIEIANKTASRASTATQDFGMGAENPFLAFSAMESAKFTPAADQLTKLKAELDEAGVPAAERPRIIADAAKANAWTEKDEDNIRQLSTGELAINPGRLFGQKDSLISEINASESSDADKQEAIQRLDAMRAATADKLATDLYYGDVKLPGAIDFRTFQEQQRLKGNEDPANVLDQWIAQQKDRNPIWKAVDAASAGIAKGELGIGKTVVGGLAGAAALTGAPGAETLAAGQQLLSATRESVTKAEKLRGADGITNDIFDTVTQMAPMFAGGAYAQGLSGLSQKVVQGMSVYGWAAAQGYESKLDDAVSMAREAKGAELTPQEVVGVLGRKETQTAAFLNGFQTAVLSKVLGGGTERAALGQAAKSMTVKDFIMGGGAKALRDGALKTELKSMAKTVLKDATDEGMEEFTNQVLDEAISTVALGKDMKLGDLLEESLKAGALGGVVGGALPQIRRTPVNEPATKGSDFKGFKKIQGAPITPDPAVEVARDLAANAASMAPKSAEAVLEGITDEETSADPPIEESPVDRSPRAKMAEKILVSQGIDPDVAKSMANDLALSGGDQTTTEEFREKVLSNFKASGGVLPSDATTYSEDIETYLASGDSQTEAEEKVRNAVAFNANERTRISENNRGIQVGKPTNDLNESPTPQTPVAPPAEENIPEGVPEAGIQPTSGEPAVGGSGEINLDVALQDATNPPSGSSNSEGYPSLTPSPSGKTQSAKAESEVQLLPGQTPITESNNGLAGKDGTVLKSDAGRIEIKHQNMLGAPRKQSVMDFVVKEDARGKGEGTRLVQEAKRRFSDLGAQVSSAASMKVFYNEGFRNPSMPDASFEEHEAARLKNGESLFVAMNDEKGKPYVTTTQTQEPVRPSGQRSSETQGVGPLAINGADTPGDNQREVGTERRSQETPSRAERVDEGGSGERGGSQVANELGISPSADPEPAVISRRLGKLFGPNFESMLVEVKDLRKRKTMPKRQGELVEMLAMLVANKGFGVKTNPKSKIPEGIVEAMVSGKPNIVERIVRLEDIALSEVTKSQTWGSVLGSVGYELEGKKYVHPRKSQPTQSPNEPNTQRPEVPPAEAAQPTPAETGAPGGPARGDGGTGAEATATPQQDADYLAAAEQGNHSKARKILNKVLASIGLPSSEKFSDNHSVHVLLREGTLDPEKDLTGWTLPASNTERGQPNAMETRYAQLSATIALVPKEHVLKGGSRPDRIKPSGFRPTADQVRVVGPEHVRSNGTVDFPKLFLGQSLDLYQTDSNGKVIPLSKRFGAEPVNETPISDTRPENVSTNTGNVDTLPPEFGNPPAFDPTSTEPLDPNPPLPELPNFSDALDEDSVTGLYHAQTDADRARLGLPPRFTQPRTTDQDAWDRATAAEDAHRAAAKPGTAGTDLLTNLLNSPPRVLDKNEHALLLHEKLVREQAVEKTQERLNNLPATTTDGERKNAQAAVQKAQNEFDLLITYADAAGSRAGLSLQARKMLIYNDFTLAAVVNRLKAAKNMRSDSPVTWTEKDQKAAVEISEKLRQAQERVEFLEDSLSKKDEAAQEQALLIEQLTKDVERAQTQLENRMRTSRARNLVRAKLDPLVEAAKARIEARAKARTTPTDNPPLMALIGPTPEMLEDLKDISIVATGWLVDKTLSLQEFSQRLVAEFGDWVAEHAQSIFRKSRSLYIETAESVSGKNAPTPTTVLESVTAEGEFDPKSPEHKSHTWKLARAHVVAGLRGRNVLDAVFGNLQTKFPNVTREQVAEAFTGYGTVVYPSAKEVPKQLQKIRTIERIGLKLADIRAGRMPKRTGFQRGEQDAEIRELEKQFREGYRALEEQMRASGIPMEDAENRLKTALGAVKRRMENEIEEMERAITSGQARAKRENVNFDSDPGYADIKKRLDAKRAEYNEFFKTEPDKLQQAKDAASKSIDRYLKMLVSGKTATPEKPSAPTDPELEELQSLRDTFAKQVAEARRVRPTADEIAKKERDAALASAEKTLTELERRITEKDLATKAKGDPKFADDTEIKAVREKIAAARETIKEMRKAAMPAKDPVAAVLKSLDRQIAEETQMLRDGILRKPKTEPLSTPEIEARRTKLREMRANRRELYAAQNPVNPLEQAKEAATKAGERLQAIIDSGDMKTRRKEPVDPDAELQTMWDANEAMRDQIDEMRKLVPITAGEAKTAIEKDLKQIEDTVSKIQAKLDSGDLSITTKPLSQRAAAVAADPRIQQARAQVKALNKELASRRRAAAALTKMSPEEAREKRILGSLKKRTQELERRMNEKDFSRPEVKPPVNTEAKRKADFEFAKVRARYEEMRHQYLLDNAPLMTKAGHYAMSAGNLLKILTLGGDIGVVMRQLGTTYQAITRDLGMLAPTKEGAAKRANGSYLKRIISEGVKSFGSKQYEHDAYERLMERQNAGWDKTAGLVLSAPFDVQRNSKEDIPAANLLDKIPWWLWPAVAGLKVSLLGASFPVSATILALGAATKPFLQALDRSQRTMTNQSRALFFDAAIDSLHDGNPSVQEAKAIAKAVMVGTGRGTATQKIESAIPLLNQVLLATRYYISRIQALTLYPLLNKDARSSRDAQKEIGKMYARSVAGRAVLYGVAALAFGKALTGDDDEPEEGLIVDPRNPNFGRVKLAEGVSLDFMSGLNNFASAATRYFWKERVDPETGRVTVLGAGFTANVNNEAVNFLKSKMNIQLSFILNTHKGEYFGGKPVNVANALEEITTAIIVNDTFNTYKAMMEEYGPVKGAARATLFLGMMFGGAGTSVRDSETEKEANRAAKREAEMHRRMKEAQANE